MVPIRMGVNKAANPIKIMPYFFRLVSFFDSRTAPEGAVLKKIEENLL